MLSLRETQKRFAQGIQGGHEADGLIVADWLQPQQRLSIYRYHFKASLADALSATFPVVVQLVGTAFFTNMAELYTAQYPPQQACLAEYGGSFPEFVAHYQPAQSLPYLADVALFEWLMTEAAHKVDYQGNAFYSAYPIGRIWETNQPDYRGDATISLHEGGGWYVVEQSLGEVMWRHLNLPENAFTTIEETTL